MDGVVIFLGIAAALWALGAAAIALHAHGLLSPPARTHDRRNATPR